MKLLCRLLCPLRGERGAELVEAAATLPVVIAILLGLVEFGWDLYAWQAARDAVRYGIRLGAVDQRTPALTARTVALDRAHEAGLHGARVDILAPGGRPGLPLALRLTYDPPNLLSRLFGLNPVITVSAYGRQEGW